MLDIPLPCKIQRDFSSEASVHLSNSGSDKIAQDTLSIFPNAIGEVFSISWVNLSSQDVQAIEYILQKSKATERLKWNNVLYLLEDEYTVEVSNNKPIINARLRRVA